LNIKTRGQTVIETVLMLLVLLMIFFVIAEFSRAWYLKNSLNNAVRRAVRTAVVTPDLTTITNACPMPGNLIVNAVCTSPGVPNTSTTKVTLQVITDTPPAGISTGDIIEVNVRAGFNTLVPALLPFMPKSAYSAAAMRYE